MKIKNYLLSIAAVSAISLSGCGYKEAIDAAIDSYDLMIGSSVNEWKNTTDNYLEIHRLLKNKEYTKAQKAVDGYLDQEMKRAYETKGSLSSSNQNKVFESINKEACKTIDSQIKKIELGLK